MLVFLFSYSALLNAIICLIFGTLVFLKYRRSRMNQVFMLLCLSVAYWAFTEYELRQSNSADQAIFWMRANFLWPMTVALMFHFTLIFTQQRRLLESKLTYFLLYGFALTVSLLDLLSDQMLGTPVEEYWGWTLDVPETTIYQLTSTAVGILAVAVIYIALRFHLKQTEKIVRRQSGLVLIGLTIPVVLGIMTELAFPDVGISVPELSTTAFAIGAAGVIGYAIRKYELFSITLAQAADRIITAISDCLFLVGPTGNILMVNRAAINLLGYSDEELVGHPVSGIFTGYQFEMNLGDTAGTGAVSLGVCDLETILLTKNGCQVPVSLSDSVMRDKYNRTLGAVLIARDITERKHAEQALRESEKRLRAIMESVQTGIVIIDSHTHTIVEINQLAASMIGATKEEIVGSVCHKYICPAEKGKCPITDLHQAVDKSERVLLTAKGVQHPIIKSVAKVMLGGKEHLLESCIDITQRKQMEEQLSESLTEKEKLVKTLDELASHDGLTGLYNHRMFFTLLTEELVRAHRFNRPVSLLMLDIDHFKGVNDTYGHLAGDTVLKELSDLMGRQVRAVDRVCRYGGEEISVILPETEADTAVDTAERLRVSIEQQPFDIAADAPLWITVSIGVASSPADTNSVQALVSAADAAMFSAKKRGRNRIARYEPAFERSETQV